MQLRKTAAFIVTLLTSVLMTAVAFAEESTAEVAAGGDEGLKYLAAALAIGAAACCGAFSQARAASAALEGIARNPNASGKIFTPMILGLALIESLVIYALIISLMIVTK